MIDYAIQLIVMTLCTLFIVAWIALSWLSHVVEKKEWNCGYCPYCTVRWKAVDSDSGKDIVYVCPSCGQIIYVSREFDRENRENNDKDNKNEILSR